MTLTDLFSNGDSRLPLPKVNAMQRVSGDESPWTPEHVRGVISNPCYAGIGPYPPLVPEDAWIHTAARTIASEGAEQFLVNMLEMLRQSFEHPPHLEMGEAEED
jgi:hypothetical protein